MIFPTLRRIPLEVANVSDVFGNPKLKFVISEGSNYLKLLFVQDRQDAVATFLEHIQIMESRQEWSPLIWAFSLVSGVCTRLATRVLVTLLDDMSDLAKGNLFFWSLPIRNTFIRMRRSPSQCADCSLLV